MEEPVTIKGKVEVSAADLILRLRESVAPTGKKGIWLRHLSDKQLAEVYHRLRAGQSMYHIVKIAQKEWRVMTASDPKSLVRGVKKFKMDVIGLIQQAKKPEDKKIARNASLTGERILANIDALGRFRWLIEIQSERLAVYLEREKTLMPLKQTSREIEVLQNLLEKYINIAIRLGLLHEKPSEFALTVKHKFDKFVGALSDGGSRVVEAAEKFMELAEKNAIRMELDPNTGKYRPVEMVHADEGFLDSVEEKAEG